MVTVDPRTQALVWAAEKAAREVTVTLNGTEQKFSLLKSEELKVSLDMSNIKDGKNEIDMTNNLVRNIGSLSVVNISPAQINLDSYRLVPVAVPVELKTKGNPSSGIVLRGIKVEPSSVSVMVPSTVPIDKVIITTEPLDLKSITESMSITTKLIIPPDIRFPGGKPPEVKVVIEIEKKEIK